MQQRFTDKTKGLFNGRQRRIVQFRSFAFLQRARLFVRDQNFAGGEDKTTVRHSLEDLNTGMILLAKFGPTSAK